MIEREYRRPLFGVLALAALITAAIAGWGALGDHPALPSDAASDVDEAVANYVAQIPLAGSGGYRAPARDERSAVREAWASLERGRIGAAQRTAERFGYAVEEHNGFVSLRGPGGLFLLATAGTDAVVEVPHPIADWSTESLGAELFARSRAAALLIAGAHRDAGTDGSADVAHRQDSVFHAVHTVASEGRTVVQLHGFADTTVPGVDVVISRGADPSPTTRAVARAIRRSFKTCLWTRAESGACDRLGARTNEQGRHLRRTGGEFIHVELSRRLREDTNARSQVVDLLASALD